MTILYAENVEIDAVAELEARGIAAAYVTDRLGAGVDDERVAAHVRETDAIVLTNDADFLEESRFPNLIVFYYPENRVAANRVARRVEAVFDIVPNVDDLPDTLFLTAEYDDA